MIKIDHLRFIYPTGECSSSWPAPQPMTAAAQSRMRMMRWGTVGRVDELLVFEVCSLHPLDVR